MPDPTTRTERYTSYHSEKTYSILDATRRAVAGGYGIGGFEYNGIEYDIEAKTLRVWGEHYRYLPREGGAGDPRNPQPPRILAEFADFESFIETFEIEGKTVKWILEHQKEWKYLCSIADIEEYVDSYSLSFVYRKIPGCIYYYFGGGPGEPPQSVGYYIGISTGVLFDVTPYAPLTPGAEHWMQHSWYLSPPEQQLTLGPYASISELLDRVRFEKKSLRELFETEYDDGAVLCASFYG